MPAYQFSLKQLLGATAYCAVLAWCVSRGAGEIVQWIALLTCVLQTATWLLCAKVAKSRVLACFLPFGWAAVSAMFLFCLGGIALLANGFLLAGVSLALPDRATSQFKWAAICLLAALVIGTIPGILGERRVMAMRREFPKEDLQERLAYESQSKPDSDVLPPLAGEVEASLFVDEAWYGGRNFDRSDDLSRIHDSQYLAFIRAEGFGVGRMLHPMRKDMQAPRIQHLPGENSLSNLNSHWRMPQRKVTNPAWSFHFERRFRFLNRESFGHHFSTERAVEIAGFLPHAFYQLSRREITPIEPWTVERLELVSLLKFPEPRVYVLDHLPRMDELSAKNAPTRELDDFEREALEQLRTTEDVVVNDQHPEVRMLGALRASSKCLECHNVPRGALLGAFSYRLRPIAPKEHDPAATDAELP